jgi:hypothetical protein
MIIGGTFQVCSPFSLYLSIGHSPLFLAYKIDRPH